MDIKQVGGRCSRTPVTMSADSERTLSNCLEQDIWRQLARSAIYELKICGIASGAASLVALILLGCGVGGNPEFLWRTRRDFFYLHALSGFRSVGTS